MLGSINFGQVRFGQVRKSLVYSGNNSTSMIIMWSWCLVISFDMMTMMSLRASTSKHHLSFLVLLCLCIVCASVLVILILICPQNSVTKRKAEEMKKEKNLFSSFFKLRYLTQARMQLDINSRYGITMQVIFFATFSLLSQSWYLLLVG